jgi:membrane-associated phospholipid phosphatase
VLVRIPKFLAGRIRPNAWWEPGPDEWNGPMTGKSFPSGHTTTAFALASVIAFQYRDNPWIPATAYSIATLAGLSRVYDNRHWFSDIFAGAVFGIATGQFICKQHEKSRFSILPATHNGSTGISLTYRW